jgi:glycerol-3-phosphate dehydrogenase
LLLNARAAIEIAPRVAYLMAQELGCDETWEAAQVKAFTEVAQPYLVS